MNLSELKDLTNKLTQKDHNCESQCKVIELEEKCTQKNCDLQCKVIELEEKCNNLLKRIEELEHKGINDVR